MKDIRLNEEKQTIEIDGVVADTSWSRDRYIDGYYGIACQGDYMLEVFEFFKDLDLSKEDKLQIITIARKNLF